MERREYLLGRIVRGCQVDQWNEDPEETQDMDNQDDDFNCG